MAIHIFGIRHHGAGSARSLLSALTELKPDIVLVEGAPEADELIPLMAHEQMQPPVAALIYSAEDNNQAVYYPFAVFSPEWQALHYALKQNIPARFMDLPMSLQFALEANEEADTNPFRHDPLSLLAEAAGFDDSERWWSYLVEERQESDGVFKAIAEAMTAVRSEIETEVPRREALREAYMRKTMRAAEKEGFQTIAVVCGAWHVPALQKSVPVKQDNDLLKGLAKVKTLATWIPWTYSRLSLASGYGAGINSPNWYEHLWNQQDKVVIHWLTQVAHHFREQGIDISAAHIIETTRLAEALAAMRGRPLPSLEEINDAIRSVMLFGDDVPMQLLWKKLIIGERLGHVPDDAPMTPLQKDLAALQKRLRLAPTAGLVQLELDLRKDTDLQRSYLLRQLRLLNIAWGVTDYARGKGTFKEAWRLQWSPEYMIQLIEAGQWGNTISEAANNFTIHQAQQSTQLEVLTKLAQEALFANLDKAVDKLINRLQILAVVSSDVLHLMTVLPSLAQLMRYGDVRKTSAEQVAIVVEGLVTRICIGLPQACSSLNEEAAEKMFGHIQAVQDVISLLANQDFDKAWYGVLNSLSNQNGLHGLLAGKCCRLLLQADHLKPEQVAQRLGLALSVGNDPAHSAAWADGFLRGSGQLLIYDEVLWQIIDNWISALSDDIFQNLLPVLRRTFATFEAPVRRQMAERVRDNQAAKVPSKTNNEYDHKRAASVLPLLGQIFNLSV